MALGGVGGGDGVDDGLGLFVADFWGEVLAGNEAEGVGRGLRATRESEEAENVR